MNNFEKVFASKDQLTYIENSKTTSVYTGVKPYSAERTVMTSNKGINVIENQTSIIEDNIPGDILDYDLETDEIVAVS